MSYINYPPTNIYPTDIYKTNPWVYPTPTYPSNPGVQIKFEQKNLAEAFNPKKAGKNKSHVIFILDDSGSMQSCRDNTINGFNEFLNGQALDAEQTGIETFVSLFKFDGSNVTCSINHENVKTVSPLTRETYNPCGGTNLLDAIGGVLMHINSSLSVNEEDRESIIITILTDGEENSSRTFANSDIKQMVEKAEGSNWGFMFLGANINAFSTGSSMGFNVNNTVQYNADSTTNTIRSASAMTSRMKCAYANDISTTAAYASMGFTDTERNASVTKDD